MLDAFYFDVHCIFEGGLAYTGSICSTNGYNTGLTGTRNGNYTYSTSTITTIATHELGHTFNCLHDQDTTCGNDGGIMGYGNNQDEFSICSIYFVQDMFEIKDVSCLQDGIRDFEQLHDPTETDDNDNDDDNGCGGYSCVGVFHLDLGQYNGGYVRLDDMCHNNEAVYYKSDGYFLYYNGHWGEWSLYNDISDNWVDTTCSESNIMDCSGEWWVYNNGEWYMDSDSYMYTCSVYDDDDDRGDDDLINSTLSTNCTNPYGSNVCIYNDGALWDDEEHDGIAIFDYMGCYNHIPFYQYTSYASDNNDDDSYSYSIITYYLYFDNINNNWMISTGNAQSVDGLAVCDEIDLTMCTYGTWTVQIIDGDSILFELSDSMGYDKTCIVDVDSDDDHNVAYCQTDASCALWQFKLVIEDTDYSNKICHLSAIECLDANLISDYTKDINSIYVCESDYQVYIYYNVSFLSTNGYHLYKNYESDYIKHVETCFDDIINIKDNSQLKIDMVYSNLKLCDNCHDFIPQTDKGVVAAHDMFTMVVSLMYTFCIAFGAS